MSRHTSPWPHRVLYTVGALVFGSGFLLAYVVLDDLKALGPFGAVGGVVLILAAIEHVEYRRMRRGG